MLTSFLKTFLSNVKVKIPPTLRILGLIAEDLLVIGGLFVLVFATFQWSKIAGLYSIGILLILIGLLLSRKPQKK